MFSDDQDCPEMEIVEIVGMSRGFLNKDVQMWKLYSMLECIVCWKHQGCPEVEIVESAGMYNVF